ncbi:MAG: hypothetical protein GY732_16460 [Gammaproteobacteria bacterium]|nr:hypothetical protein [Gammaproteobacteria bacterium]
MHPINSQAQMYAATAFSYQIVLLIHFILRKWAFDSYIHQYGWGVYALAIPAVIVSVILIRQGAEWWMWTGGFLYLAWAIFGYVVEYQMEIPWRSPINWFIFVPYLLLFFSTTMFYWWPLARLGGFLWLACTFIFVISTFLNVSSH